MRKVDAVRAALANLLFGGLGYVYLGRLSLAVTLVLACLGLVAIAGWSGLVFEPVIVYAVVAVFLGLVLMTTAHAAILARRHRELPIKPYNRWWFYILWIAAGWFFPDLLLQYRAPLLGFESFRAPSSSMAPTIDRGDFVIVDARYFARHEPVHGQLVTFRLPDNEDVVYLKRVVGLPGDVIEIRDDVLYRNGEAVDEPYIQLSNPGRFVGSEVFVTPDASYFVLGDNRHNSLDSRRIGAIPARLLHGRVEHRWFAVEHGGRIRWERFPERLSEVAE